MCVGDIRVGEGLELVVNRAEIISKLNGNCRLLIMTSDGCTVVQKVLRKSN